MISFISMDNGLPLIYNQWINYLKRAVRPPGGSR